jgi:cytochrome c biogenesis protein CcmG/thiol:disulfide interchange protein DsbE
VLAVVAVVAVVTVVVIDGNDGSSSAPVMTGNGDRGVVASVAAGSPDIGAPAPDFTLTGLDGKPVRLSDYRGRPVVVNFWASWCNPCRREFPLLAAARAAHRKDGLEVIGVSYRDIPSDARAFAADKGATWPLARDDDQVVANAYGVRAVPQTFFVDRDGVVRERLFGITSAAELEQNLASITKRPANS